ncbi:hypothetical protein D3C71_412140 [compost metagenome]
MAVILNLIAFVACIFWFHRMMKGQVRKPLFPLILVYLGSCTLSFFIVLTVQPGYPDNVIHFMTGAVFIFLFWLWTMTVIILKHRKSSQTKHIWVDLAQTSLLLIFPIIVVFVINNLPSKIGGVS